jgi:hypothetical protein
MEKVKIATQYRITMSEEQYQRLLAFDEMGVVVSDSLETLGLTRVDYNSYNGPAIYFTIDAELETPELWKQIETIVQKATRYQGRRSA